MLFAILAAVWLYWLFLVPTLDTSPIGAAASFWPATTMLGVVSVSAVVF